MMSSDRNEHFEELKVLLHEKQAGNKPNIFVEEIVAVAYPVVTIKKKYKKH